MPKNETVCIVGTHPGTRADAPYDDPNLDIWVFNEAFVGAWVGRYDGIFQLHVPDIYTSPLNRNDPKHYQHLQEATAPIFMQDVDPTIPQSVKYPLQEIRDRFLAGNSYFTSSIDYALALALYRGYKKIIIYGVEMASHTEYHYQRNGVRLWLAIAYALGVTVEIRSGLQVFDTADYGYDGIITTDTDSISSQVRELRAKADELTEQVHAAEKRLRVAYYTTPSSVPQKISELLALTQQQGETDGMLAEYERYQHKLEQIVSNGDIPYIDRNELESAAALAIKTLDVDGGLVHRTAGRLDYVLNAWEKLNDPRALEQVKMLAVEHVAAGYKAAYKQGQYKTNHLLAGEMDKRIAAAGGERAKQIITGEIWQEQ